jgi:hypothetical protein
VIPVGQEARSAGTAEGPPSEALSRSIRIAASSGTRRAPAAPAGCIHPRTALADQRFFPVAGSRCCSAHWLALDPFAVSHRENAVSEVRFFCPIAERADAGCAFPRRVPGPLGCVDTSVAGIRVDSVCNSTRTCVNALAALRRARASRRFWSASRSRCSAAASSSSGVTPRRLPQAWGVRLASVVATGQGAPTGLSRAPPAMAFSLATRSSRLNRKCRFAFLNPRNSKNSVSPRQGSPFGISRIAEYSSP